MKDVKTLLLLTSVLVATLAYGQSAKSSAVGDNTWLGPGLVTAEETISPNGRYAIVVDEGGSSESQLADVIGHRLLGKIPGTDYWAYGNHRVNAWWAADSSWCAAVRYNRLGFDECFVIGPAATASVRPKLGSRFTTRLKLRFRSNCVIRNRIAERDYFCGRATTRCWSGRLERRTRREWKAERPTNPFYQGRMMSRLTSGPSSMCASWIQKSTSEHHWNGPTRSWYGCYLGIRRGPLVLT